MIPKKLHMIWVGDESKRPKEWIQTWIDNHPDWEVKVWGNEELHNRQWHCQKQLDIMVEEKVWPAVANIMRYEILYEEGGVYVDADSISLKPIDDQFWEPDFWVIYESEEYRGYLLANGYIGSVPKHEIMRRMIDHIQNIKGHPLKKFVWYKLRVKRLQSWKMLGPQLFTDIIYKSKDVPVKIFPSYTFHPVHVEDVKNGRIETIDRSNSYAEHFWGNSFGKY